MGIIVIGRVIIINSNKTVDYTLSDKCRNFLSKDMSKSYNGISVVCIMFYVTDYIS